MIVARRTIFYALLCACLLFPSCKERLDEEEEEEEFAGKLWNEYGPLHEIYTDKFPLGNIIARSDLDTVRFEIIKHHYKIITAENQMKPDQIAPSSDPGSDSVVWNYRFTNADAIVNAAEEAGLKVHGHTLIWHSQSPAWLAAGGEPYLTKFVSNVVTRYKDKILSWDVVNEAFTEGNIRSDEVDKDNWADYLRSSPWRQSIGDTYIEKAFRAARAADPAAKLYYNDFNLNGEGKRLATYYMVKEINDKWLGESNSRLLIEGIGMQSHHHLNTDPESVRASIELFASLGVEVGITEMDIVAANGGSINDSRLGEWNEEAAKKQAAQYAAMFRVFIENAQYISRVTFWGLDDGTSWRRVNYPTLLDKDYKSKRAFEAVMDPSQY